MGIIGTRYVLYCNKCTSIVQYRWLWFVRV